VKEKERKRENAYWEEEKRMKEQKTRMTSNYEGD